MNTIYHLTKTEKKEYLNMLIKLVRYLDKSEAELYKYEKEEEFDKELIFENNELCYGNVYSYHCYQWALNPSKINLKYDTFPHKWYDPNSNDHSYWNNRIIADIEISERYDYYLNCFTFYIHLNLEGYEFYFNDNMKLQYYPENDFVCDPEIEGLFNGKDPTESFYYIKSLIEYLSDKTYNH